MFSSLLALVVTSQLHWLATMPIQSEHLDAIVAQDMCLEYVDEALATGWESQDLERLLYIMHRESRCLPDACGVTDRPDLRRCRDWGLMQINDYSWKKKVHEMDLSMEDMTDPFWNLFFARVLFDLATVQYGCGWQPWNGTCEGSK